MLSDLALSRLVQQYRNRPRLRALVRALAAEYVDIESTLTDLQTRLDIEKSEGVQLDGIGEIVGQPRPFLVVEEDTAFAFAGPVTALGFASLEEPDQGGKFVGLDTVFGGDELVSDTDYRPLLRAAVRSNYSASAADDILGFIMQSLGLRARLSQAPGSITIQFTRELFGYEQRIIQDALPVAAGVRYEIGPTIVDLFLGSSPYSVGADSLSIGAGVGVALNESGYPAASDALIIGPLGVVANLTESEFSAQSDAMTVVAGVGAELAGSGYTVQSDALDLIRWVLESTAYTVQSDSVGAMIGTHVHLPGAGITVQSDAMSAVGGVGAALLPTAVAAESDAVALTAGQSVALAGSSYPAASDPVSVRAGQSLAIGSTEITAESDGLTVILSHDPAVVWHADFGSDQLYELDASDFSVLSQASSPGAAPLGVGGSLDVVWHCDNNVNQVYELDPADFSIIAQASSPDGDPSGIGGDAATIWHCDSGPGAVYELDPADFSIIAQASSPGGDPFGIGGDAATIWHCDRIDERVYELDPADFSIIAQASSPDGLPGGVGGKSQSVVTA